MPKGLQRHLFGDRTDEVYHPEILRHPSLKGATKPDDARVFLLSVERDQSRAKSDDGIIWVIGTDGSEDRHGSVLNPAGWDIAAYLRNPVLLAFHDGGIPAIGTTETKRVGGRWEFGLRFAVDAWAGWDGPNLAKLFNNLYEADVMRAVSVSFLPKEWKDREAETIPSYFAENVEFVKQELTELSCVNVPSCRNALKKALGDGLVSEREVDFLGLGSALRFDLPTIIATKPAATPAREPESDRTVGDGAQPREVSSEPRSYWNPVTPLVAEYAADEKQREIDALAEMADDALALVDSALVRWRAAKSEPLRWSCREQIITALFWYDSAAEWSREWYGVTLGDANVSEDALDGLRAMFDLANDADFKAARERADDGGFRERYGVRMGAYFAMRLQVQREFERDLAGDRAPASISTKGVNRLKKAMALIGECITEVEGDGSTPPAGEKSFDLDAIAREIGAPESPESELESFIRSNIGVPTASGSADRSTPQDPAPGTPAPKRMSAIEVLLDETS